MEWLPAESLQRTPLASPVVLLPHSTNRTLFASGSAPTGCLTLKRHETSGWQDSSPPVASGRHEARTSPSPHRSVPWPSALSALRRSLPSIPQACSPWPPARRCDLASSQLLGDLVAHHHPGFPGVLDVGLNRRAGVPREEHDELFGHSRLHPMLHT